MLLNTISVVRTEEVGAVGAGAGGLARFVPGQNSVTSRNQAKFDGIYLNSTVQMYARLSPSLSLFSCSIFLPGMSPGAVGWTPT